MSDDMKELLRYCKQEKCKVQVIRDYFIISEPFLCVVCQQEKFIALQYVDKTTKNTLFAAKRNIKYRITQNNKMLCG